MKHPHFLVCPVCAKVHWSSIYFRNKPHSLPDEFSETFYCKYCKTKRIIDRNTGKIEKIILNSGK